MVKYLLHYFLGQYKTRKDNIKIEILAKSKYSANIFKSKQDSNISLIKHLMIK